MNKASAHNCFDSSAAYAFGLVDNRGRPMIDDNSNVNG